MALKFEVDAFVLLKIFINNFAVPSSNFASSGSNLFLLRMEKQRDWIERSNARRPRIIHPERREAIYYERYPN